jgi:Flp pilus assembly protein TadD
VTFNNNIAPVLIEHCAPCHRPGQQAPFSVLDYGDVRRHVQQIASATRLRLMPPWLPESGYGEFAGERRLSDRDIELIQQWVQQGAIEGDPAHKPQIPAWPDGWQLGEPDQVLEMKEPYTLLAGDADVFRNFVIPLQQSAVRYLRAIEFRPSDPRLIHHAVIGFDPTRSSRTLDRVDGEPGFADMPGPLQSVVGWTPGKGPSLEPPDMAQPLEPGSDLIVELHLLPTSRPETVQVRVGLFFTDTPPSRVPFMLRLGVKTIDIPPGQADYAVDDTYVLPVDVDALSVYPHAHFLGREMRGLAVLPDGAQQPLIWIKKWNFHWQDEYRYTRPLFLPKGTTLRMHFTYDNSSANSSRQHGPPRRVFWGPRSSDEMGDLWLRVVPRRREDAAILKEDFVDRELHSDIAAAEKRLQVDPADGGMHNKLGTLYLMAGRVDEAIAELERGLRLKSEDVEAHNILGTVLSRGRLPEAIQHLQKASQLAPDDDRLHFNLGNALELSGRVNDAVHEFSRAIEINPSDADAHHNLGVALVSERKLDEGIQHLRRAVDIRPEFAEAHNSLGAALGRKGDFDEARRHISEALRIRPDFAEARENLSALRSRDNRLHSPH